MKELFMQDFEEIPVSYKRFISDPYYLGNSTGNGKGIYPYWIKEAEEIHDPSKNYYEIARTGSIGQGKTSVSVIDVCYDLYKMMCLRDPHKYFNLQVAQGNLTVLFFNTTQKLASATAYKKFQDTLQRSPWFLERGTVTGRQWLEYKPNKPIVFKVASDADQALGGDVFTALFDEVNFKNGADQNLSKSKMMEIYSTLSKRMKSRFVRNGKILSKAYLVSSKKSEYDFLEQYIQRRLAEEPEAIHVSDAAIWEVHPPGRYSKETFNVLVGSENEPSRILDPSEDVQSFIKAGRRITSPPVTLLPEYKIDIDRAIQDLSGISLSHISKFFQKSSILKCIDRSRENPFTANIISLGTNDSLEIKDFFIKERLPGYAFSQKIFLHIDTSYKNDKTGITAVCQDPEKILEKDLHYVHLFSVGIKCPADGEISFQKTRQFIYYLKHTLGMNIALVTTDGFQSVDTRQQLESSGIKSSLYSLDRTPDGYLALRNAINEGRIKLLYINELIEELVNLERNNMSGKIDHPIDGCFTGDTKIKLVDGRSLSITELLLEQEYKDNWVYTFNEQTQRIEPKKIKKVFQTKITSDLVKVTLDNGEEIFCTPEHRFMLRDGSYKEAQELLPGQSMMPLYTRYPERKVKNYRMYYEPMTDSWHFEHRQFCMNNTHKKGYVVHHCNYQKGDNRPTNLDCIEKSEHTRIHNNRTKDYSKVSKGLKAYYQELRETGQIHDRVKNWKNKAQQDPEAVERQRAHREELAQRVQGIKEVFNIDYYSLDKQGRRNIMTKYLDHLDPERVKRRRENNSFFQGKKAKPGGKVDKKRQLVEEINKTFNVDYYSFDKAGKARLTKQLKRLKNPEDYESSRYFWVNNGKICKQVCDSEEIPEGFVRGRLRTWKNHQVISVERVHKPCRVYDLEIEDNHNFALDAGIFVHNSKDVADSLAGSAHGCSSIIETSSASQFEDLDSMLEVNMTGIDDVNYQRKLFEQLLPGGVLPGSFGNDDTIIDW